MILHWPPSCAGSIGTFHGLTPSLTPSREIGQRAGLARRPRLGPGRGGGHERAPGLEATGGDAQFGGDGGAPLAVDETIEDGLPLVGSIVFPTVEGR